jgi:Domain of unknown function (DUF4440)
VIQSVAPTLGLDVSLVNVRDPPEIERSIAALHASRLVAAEIIEADDMEAREERGVKTMIGRRRLLLGAALGVAFDPPMAMAEPADKAALLAELMKLEVASWQFLKDTNVPAVKDYLADDALLIFGDGMLFTKAEYIKAMPDIRLDSFTIEPNADIIVWTPEVATVLCRITYASAMKNAKASTMKALSSSTYVRRNGNWLSALYQETPVP